MKKNGIIKTLMKLFALLASISGIVFLFRDKICSCKAIQKLIDSRKNCPLFSKLRSYGQHSDVVSEEVDEDEEAFEHAFDEDPATSREYVSLNINPHREDIMDDQEQTKES